VERRRWEGRHESAGTAVRKMSSSCEHAEGHTMPLVPPCFVYAVQVSRQMLGDGCLRGYATGNSSRATACSESGAGGREGTPGVYRQRSALPLSGRRHVPLSRPKCVADKTERCRMTGSVVPALARNVARGRCEAVLRCGPNAPTFYCCHCHRSGQTLKHIAACGKNGNNARTEVKL
jgi:hypothetical protein